MAADGDMALAPRAPRARASAGSNWHLPDGTPVTIRAIEPGDLRLERRFVYGLSERTRYQRLLSARRKLLPGELERLTRIDPEREMALLAVASIGGRDTGLGVARYVRDADGNGSDFAIVVGDRWQGQGLGEELLRRLMQRAAAAGVGSMSGITLSTNVSMLRLARKLGFSARRDGGDATTTNLYRELQPPAGAALRLLDGLRSWAALR